MLEFCHPYKMYKYTCLTTVLSIETCSQQQKLLSKDDENKEKEEIKNRRRIAFKAPSSMLSVPTITGLNPSFTQNAEQQGSTAFTSPHKRQFKEKHHYTHARKHTHPPPQHPHSGKKLPSVFVPIASTPTFDTVISSRIW